MHKILEAMTEAFVNHFKKLSNQADQIDSTEIMG